MEINKNSEKNKNTKVTNKARTLPPVRQTLTSYKRMLKVNPLLKYEEAGVDIDQLLGTKSKGTNSIEGTSSTKTETHSKVSSSLEVKPSSREFKKPDVPLIKRTQSLKLPKSNGLLQLGTKKPTIISGNLALANNNSKKSEKSNSVTSHSNVIVSKPKSEISSTIVSSHKVENKKPVEAKAKVSYLPKTSVSTKCKSDSSTNKRCLKTDHIKKEPKQLKKEIPNLRRSFSSPNFQSKKTVVHKQNPDSSTITHSQENEDNFYTLIKIPPEISPILGNSNSNENYIFKDPSAYKRRSICQLTHSARKIPFNESSTPATIETDKLLEKLQYWVTSRGKLISPFQHLRYFGKNDRDRTPATARNNDENKENINTNEEAPKCNKSLEITTTPESSKVDTSLFYHISEEELPRAAKEAMVELQNLIQEDYPRAQCLGWLELIRQKYRKADEEPEYWECKAAVEQSMGNVGNAVEFYKTAIIQGAEVTNVDRSLEQLLQKFSLLNLSSKSEQKNVDGEKERIVREARNVFKFSIIQCAIQERQLTK